MALFAARLERTSEGAYSILGAPSVVRDGDPLLALYGDMIDFYGDLLGRPLPSEFREPILVVPSWFDRAYGIHRSRSRTGAEGAWALVMPLLGRRLVFTEHHAASVAELTAKWLETGEASALFEASKLLHDAVQQSLWAGAHPHLPFTRSPVVLGIADFARLQWLRKVMGEEAYRQAVSTLSNLSGQRRSSSVRAMDDVLQLLVELDDAMGRETVRHALGWAYDRLNEGELEYEAFVRHVQSLRLD